MTTTTAERAWPPVRRTRTLGVVTLALLVTALFLNLGLPPLRLEEPRRALIALEMIFSGDLLVPTEFGEPYLNKPPLWNWLIVAAFRLFGGYTEFAVRVFSVLALLAMGGVMYLMGRRYLGEQQATTAALLFLVCGDLLFYMSMLGEIDLFYACLSFAALAALFHYHEQGAPWTAFGLFYLLNALGTLTKGLPSVAFAGVGVVVFLFYRRDLRRLFSVAHVAGVLLFVLVAGSYLLAYGARHPVAPLLLQLGTEAGTRTLAAGDNLGRLPIHLVSFPLNTLASTLPAALMAPFLFHRRFRAVLGENPLIEYYTWVGLAVFALYWISPGSAQRHIYMLYPPLVAVLVWSHQRLADAARRRVRILEALILALLALGVLIGAALPFVPLLARTPGLLAVSVGTSLLALALLALAWRHPPLRIWALIWLPLLLRLTMDLTVVPYRAQHGSDQRWRATGVEIAAIGGVEPVRLYRDATHLRAIVFYLERASGRVVRRGFEPSTAGLFIADPAQVSDVPHEVLLRFTDDRDRSCVLVRFREDSSARDHAPRR